MQRFKWVAVILLWLQFHVPTRDGAASLSWHGFDVKPSFWLFRMIRIGIFDCLERDFCVNQQEPAVKAVLPEQQIVSLSSSSPRHPCPCETGDTLKSKTCIQRKGPGVSRVDGAELLVHQQRPALFYNSFFWTVLQFKRAEMTAAAQQRAAALAVALWS